MGHLQTNAVLHQVHTLLGRADTGDLSDRELLHRFATQRDEGAFETLVRGHGPMVLRLCQRVLERREDAEDAFQATFLVLARKAATLTWRDSVGAWLYAVAHRLARETRRKRIRQQIREARIPTRTVADPLTEMSGRELVHTLDEELAGLPEQYRAPLLLCCLEDKSGDEEAAQLHCSLSTLKRRLRLGRELLQRRLGRRGFTLSADGLSVLLLQNTATALPRTLVNATLQAATLFAAGEPMTAGAASAQAVALAQGATRALAGTQLKVLVAVLLVVGLAAGAGALAKQGPGEQPSGALTADVAEPAAPGKQVEAAPGRTDRFGDPLPEEALTRIGTVRFRHDQWVGPFVLTADGATIVTAAGRTIALWEASSGRALARYTLPIQARSLDSSPDGKLLAVGGSDCLIHLLDAATGKEVRQCAGHQPDPRESFSGVLGVLFGPRGDWLVSWGSDQTVRLWATATGKELRRLAGNALEPWSVALSPDGKRLAVSVGKGEQPVSLWDVEIGKEVRRLASPGPVTRVIFAPDGQTLVGSAEMGQKPSQILRWDVATGKELGSFAAHESQVFTLAFAPDGKTLATGGYDRTIRFWEPASGKELRKIGPLGSPLYLVAFTGDGKTLVSRAAEDLLRLWDPATGKELLSRDAPTGDIASVAYSANGKLLAVASGKVIRLCDAATGRELRKLEGHEGPLFAVAFAGDGHLLSSGQDSTLRIWEAASGKELRRIQLGKGWIRALALAPDQLTLASWTHEDVNSVVLWRADTGAELRRLELPSTGGVLPTVSGLCFSADGKALFASSGTHTHLLRWDVATGKELPPLGLHDGGLSWIALSPDGHSVATASLAGTVYVWELATGQARLIVKDAGYTTVLAFTPDGQFLALANNGMHRLQSGGKTVEQGWENRTQVRLLDVGDGKVVHTFAGHLGGVNCLAFSPDGKRLASGGRDTTVLLWDAISWRKAAARPGKRLEPADLDALWTGLIGEADKARHSVAALAATPAQAVPFLKEHVHPAVAADGQRVAKLLKQLDSEEFAERQKAMDELKTIASAAEPALRKALEGKPSLEIRQRLAQLLGELDVANPGSERLRTWRALEALERSGDAAAQELLRRLAGGDPEAWLTREAKATLERVARRTAAR